jgi:hypothetical protein
MSEAMIADKIVIWVPYTFLKQLAVADHVTNGNEYAYDNSERKKSRQNKGKVYGFGFSGLRLHGVLYQFVNR